MGQLRGAPVLLHVEAEQRRFVVEHPVAVRVTVDRAVRHPVAVVGRGGVVEAVAVGKGDRRVEGVVAAREVDRLEREQRADAVRRVGAAVEGPRLQRRVPDGGVVAVGQHVVVAQHVDVARRVHDARPDRARGNRGMAD